MSTNEIVTLQALFRDFPWDKHHNFTIAVHVTAVHELTAELFKRMIKVAMAIGNGSTNNTIASFSWAMQPNTMQP